MVRPTVPGGVVGVCDSWVGLAEAVQVELTDEAGEVGGLEGVRAVRGDGARREDLSLEQVLVNDDERAVAVPADGFICRVVHQTPQFGRKVIRVDAFREGASTNIHAFVSRTGKRETIDQFEYDGCDNCESYLQMKGNREMVYECTSSSFDGVIAMMSPEDSWVAKWQRIGNFKPGVYAVSVTGRLPPGVVRELKSRGVIYKSRDTAVKT
uniref:SPT4 homolog, DSIF elongation factor subunit n=3 Tax=Percomorphaceae TaxID=1489872 RepID=A0A8P4G0Q0_DICLA